MAQQQISRIQHRRGPLVDLAGVILNGGELGWALDERRLYIGNRETEGAPIDENVEILTEYSSINYEYIDTISGVRTARQRLRDRVSILDFDLDISDAAATQTTKFQTAFDYLYNPSNASVTPHSGATLFVPADAYSVDVADYNSVGSSGIRLYPNTKLVGDSPFTTSITSSSTTEPVAITSSNDGTNGTVSTLVEDIYVEGLDLAQSSTGTPLVQLDNAKNVYFVNCKFTGTGTTGTAVGLGRDTITTDLGNYYFINCEFDGFTTILNWSDTNTTQNIHFSRCKFSNSTTGLIFGDGINDVVITECLFDTITNAAIDIRTTNATGFVVDKCLFVSCGTGIDFGVTGGNLNVYGHSSRNNLFDTCTTGIAFSSNAESRDNVSLMDLFEACTTNINLNGTATNLVLGQHESYGLGSGAPAESTFGTTGADTTFLSVVTNKGGSTVDKPLSVLEFIYSLTQNSVERMGTFRVISDGTNVTYDDDFIEVGGSTTLDLKAAMDGGTTDQINVQYNATTNTATFKYNLRTWLN